MSLCMYDVHIHIYDDVHMYDVITQIVYNVMGSALAFQTSRLGTDFRSIFPYSSPVKHSNISERSFARLVFQLWLCAASL